MNDYPAAVADMRNALKLHEDEVTLLNDFAWLRATAPDAAVRDGRESVRLAQKSLSLPGGRTCGRLDTLAAAYAEAGDYPRAIESEQSALATASKEIQDPDKARDFQKTVAERLKLFEQHQPCRTPYEAN